MYCCILIFSSGVFLFLTATLSKTFSLFSFCFFKDFKVFDEEDLEDFEERFLYVVPLKFLVILNIVSLLLKKNVYNIKLHFCTI